MINLKTINLVKEYEGYGKRLADGRCMAYLDRNATPANPNYDHTAGGLWTIGYGATGPEVTEGTIWTQLQADLDLSTRLGQSLAAAKKYITADLNENQEGAVASITYNIGTGTPAQGNGLQKLYQHINEDADNAGQYFMAYNHGHVDGALVVMKGLTRRRAAEKELYEWEVKKQIVAISPPMQSMNKAQQTTGVFGAAGVFLWTNWQQFSEMAKDHVGLILLAGLGLGFVVPEAFKWIMHREFDKGTYIPEGTKPVDPLPEAE